MDRINFLLKNKIYVLIMLVLVLTIPAIDLVRAQCYAPGTACSTTPTINTGPGACGSTSLPVMASGTSTPVACPGGCAGSVAVSCLNGVYTARPNCTIPIGACGATTCYRCSPGAMPGSTCVVDFSGPSQASDCSDVSPFICY